MPPTTARTPTRDDWHWVVQHSETITRAVKRFRPTGVDTDDAIQDFVLYLAQRVHSYDPAKGKPSTWINMKARAMRTDILRKAATELRRKDAARGDVYLQQHTNQARQIEQRVEVSMILDRADDHHREAAASVLEGHSVKDVPDAIGISYQARDGRLLRLAKRHPDYRAA